MTCDKKSPLSLSSPPSASRLPNLMVNRILCHRSPNASASWKRVFNDRGASSSEPSRSRPAIFKANGRERDTQGASTGLDQGAAEQPSDHSASRRMSAGPDAPRQRTANANPRQGLF